MCSTVEAAPLDRDFSVGVIDEVQLLADPQRGPAWTRAFLGLRVLANLPLWMLQLVLLVHLLVVLALPSLKLLVLCPAAAAFAGLHLSVPVDGAVVVTLVASLKATSTSAPAARCLLLHILLLLILQVKELHVCGEEGAGTLVESLLLQCGDIVGNRNKRVSLASVKVRLEKKGVGRGCRGGAVDADRDVRTSEGRLETHLQRMRTAGS